MSEDDNIQSAKWLLPAFGSSLFWAISDTLCDVCIEENDSDSEEDIDWDDDDNEVDENYGEKEKLNQNVVEDQEIKGTLVNLDKEKSRTPHSDNSGLSERRKHRPSENGLMGTKLSFGGDGSGLGNSQAEVEMVSLLNGQSNATGKIANGEIIDHERSGGSSSKHKDKDFKDGRKINGKSNHNVDDRDIYLSGNVVKVPEALQQATGMDGEQDAAIAGIVSTFFCYMMSLKRWNAFMRIGTYDPFAENIVQSLAPDETLLWSPIEDIEWWLAAVGGVMLWFHYILVLWAFDSAPSTVINPLVQMSSVWVLLGSAIPAALLGNTFIRPLDLLCYAIIVVGGILPSIDGNFRKMFTRKFWTKPFIKNVVLSEVSLGMYDLMVSYCLQTSAKKTKFSDLSASALEDEFFYISWCWFSISFAVSFALVPRLNAKVTALQFNIPKKYLFFSALSQTLTLLAFYFSAFAYAWFYQASVVHAAESSLEQGFNLMIAFLLRKVFNLGRDSAIKDMKVKVISCLVISVGLFLIAYQDEIADKNAYFEYRKEQNGNGGDQESGENSEIESNFTRILSSINLEGVTGVNTDAQKGFRSSLLSLRHRRGVPFRT